MYNKIKDIEECPSPFSFIFQTTRYFPPYKLTKFPKSTPFKSYF